MAEIERAIARQFQSLSIVFDCAVKTKLASVFGFEFSLQIYMEITGWVMFVDVGSSMYYQGLSEGGGGGGGAICPGSPV
jgi:hypothetical protein